MQKRARVVLTSTILAAVLGWTAGCDITEPPGDDGSGVPEPGSTGAITVRTTTWGRLTDPNGYVVSIDGGVERAIGTSDSLTVDNLARGDHLVSLDEVDEGCLVEGSNPRVVTLGSRTTFRVNCGGSAMSLAVESVEDQTGRPGEAVAEQLVARLTEASGGGVAGAEVTWTITAGDGTLAGTFRPDDTPVRTVHALTDTEGRTRVPVIPLAFETLDVVAHVDGAEESPVTFRVDATDPGASLAVVSGGDQPAQAGRRLTEPFVIRLTDGNGDPALHVAVAWHVASGDGDLGRDRHGARVLSDTVRTDAEGLAQVFLTPTWFGPVEVSAAASGVGGSPATIAVDATDPGASLTIVSGEGQPGKAADVLDEPFVVVATDGLGNPAPNVRVSWALALGEGTFGDYWAEWSWLQEQRVYTDGQGRARATFSPASLGTVAVDATLDGTASTSTFTTDVDVLVIHYDADSFYGIGFDDVTCTVWSEATCAETAVPLGTSVEWVNHLVRARIVSTSRPVDGVAFDSGPLSQEERFVLVPTVVGTWEYEEAERGIVSRLRVH